MAAKDRGGRRPTGGAPRSGRRQHLDEITVARVCDVIRSWPDAPLRWEDLVATLTQRGIGTWTRQALSSKPAIIKAVQARKDAMAKGVKRRPRDPEVVLLRQEVDSLKARVEELLAKLAWYEERHLTMLRNASVRGLTEEEIMKALPPIDRSKF